MNVTATMVSAGAAVVLVILAVTGKLAVGIVQQQLDRQLGEIKGSLSTLQDEVHTGFAQQGEHISALDASLQKIHQQQERNWSDHQTIRDTYTSAQAMEQAYQQFDGRIGRLEDLRNGRGKRQADS